MYNPWMVAELKFPAEQLRACSSYAMLVCEEYLNINSDLINLGWICN